MKTINKLIMTSLLLSSLQVFAGDGAGGGNGGDPADIMQQIKGSKTQIDEPVLRDEVDQYHYAIALKNFQESKARAAKAGFVNLAVVASSAYQLLSKLNYPFNFPGKAPNPSIVSETLRKLLGGKTDWYLDYENIITVSRLTVDGHEVMFRSNPGVLKVEVSADRFFETLMRDNRPEPVSVIAARIATVFHEALIINGIETSRSYPYSNKFAIALRAMMTDPKFGDWARYAMDKGNVSPQDILPEINILKASAEIGFSEIQEIKGTKNESKAYYYRKFIFSRSMEESLNFYEPALTNFGCRGGDIEKLNFKKIDISPANKNFPDYLLVSINDRFKYGKGRINKNGFIIKMEDGSTIRVVPSKLIISSGLEYDSFNVFKNDVQVNNPTGPCTMNLL